MRTTISIPDTLAERLHRRAMQERVERLEREELAQAMDDGYAAEAAAPSIDSGWGVTEIEGWK